MPIFSGLGRAGILGARTLTRAIAGIFYVTVEGCAFLFSPYGLGVLVAAEMAAFAKVSGPGKLVQVASKAALATIVGRGIHIGFLVFSAKKRGSDKGVEEAREEEEVREQVGEESIWDWEPPIGDAFSSGAWFVLKQLVLTVNQMKRAYPEIEELLNRPEMQPAELASRLYYYYSDQEMLPQGENVDMQGSLDLDDDQDIFGLQKYREFACYAYDYTNDASLCEVLEGQGYALLAAKYKPELVPSGSPAYYFAVCDNNYKGDKELLLCVRGTYSPEDVFTDLFATGTSFGEKGNAHLGMAKAALHLKSRFGILMKQWTIDGNKVTLIGHSLGAGVASLLALSLHDDGIKAKQLKCYAYEPPACMDLPLAEQCRRENFVVSVVNRDDMVPRLAALPFVNLLKDLIKYDWKARAEKHQDMPLVLKMIISLAQWSSKATTERTMEPVSAAVEGLGSDDKSGYNPVVPGKIIYITPQEHTVQEEEDDDRESVSSFVKIQGAIRNTIDSQHPLLTKVRLSPSMLKDHFIDTDEFMQSLNY